MSESRTGQSQHSAGYSAPMAPAPPAQQPVGPPPPLVVTGFRLMLVNAVLEALAIIVAAATTSSLRSAIETNQPTWSPSKVDSAVHVAVGTTVVFGVIITVLYLVLSWQVRNGKNWARIVTWVIAGLGVLGSLLSLGNAASGGARVLSIIAGLIDIAIIVLLARNDSSAYFKRRPY